MPDSTNADRAQRYAEVLIAEGCAPGASIHSWRCEYPDMYGPCDCVAETARAVMAVADAEQAELRTKVARVEVLAEEWGDWPITAQGQAADLLRDIRAALDGDA